MDAKCKSSGYCRLDKCVIRSVKHHLTIDERNHPNWRRTRIHSINEWHVWTRIAIQIAFYPLDSAFCRRSLNGASIMSCNNRSIASLQRLSRQMWTQNAIQRFLSSLYCGSFRSHSARAKLSFANSVGDTYTHVGNRFNWASTWLPCHCFVSFLVRNVEYKIRQWNWISKIKWNSSVRVSGGLSRFTSRLPFTHHVQSIKPILVDAKRDTR